MIPMSGMTWSMQLDEADYSEVTVYGVECGSACNLMKVMMEMTLRMQLDEAKNSVDVDDRSNAIV
jgi:hypothetical protein